MTVLMMRLRETNMYAYELLPKLIHLTLTANNEAEYWEEKLEFIGTNHDWLQASLMEEKLCSE